MRTRSVLTRAGAVVVSASLAVLSAAIPASADKAMGTAPGKQHDIAGYNVNLDGMPKQKTALFGLKLDGGNTLRMYCVEVEVDLRHGETMVETPWDQFPNPHSPFHENRGKIHWVLQHGYPAVASEALENTLGADTLHDGLSTKEAIAGTQAAVWHFSDDKELSRPDATIADDDADQDVLSLYDYLTGQAKDIEEPTPTLDLAPAEASGKAGDRIGPFTASMTGDVSDLKTDLPEGTKLTDADGNDLAESDIADGAEIYVDVPDDADANSGSFEIEAAGHVNTGRLFVAGNYQDRPAQSLIVAQSEDVTLSAGAVAKWESAPTTTKPSEETTTTTAPPASTTTETPAPTTTSDTPVASKGNEGDLAQTGFSATTPLLIGAVLVLAGAGVLLLQRRRKSSTN